MGVKIGKQSDRDTFEVKLLRKKFGLKQDLRIFFTYASPINSGYTQSREINILDKLAKDLDGKNCIIMGDLNGRTKKGDDFVRDIGDKYSPINTGHYEKDSYLSRSNCDTHQIDTQGRKILDFCKFSSFRILNGRTRGDMEGKFTRFPRKFNENPSVIDYTLCGSDFLSEIHSFKVSPFTGLSDHCCISVNIHTHKPLKETEVADDECNDEAPINRPTFCYTFDWDKKEEFEQNLSRENIDSLLSSLKYCDVNRENIDKYVGDLNGVLLDAVQQTFPMKKSLNRKSKNNKKPKNEGWFNKECTLRRKVFRRYSPVILAFDPE